ncbi:hypothetical protein PMAYCL1PPCAC_20766, partial [Pristionchus mayeri]
FAGILTAKFAARETFSSLSTRFLFSPSPNAQRVSTIFNWNFLPVIGESARKISTFEVGGSGINIEEKLDDNMCAEIIFHKRMSSKGEVDDSKSVVKKYQKLKESDTGMECPECEFNTRNVGTYVSHLRRKHSTTPVLAGLSFLCECGYESSSVKHMYKYRTQSVGSFVKHLRKKHSTTPPLAGISFLCECGHESSSENHGRK